MDSIAQVQVDPPAFPSAISQARLSKGNILVTGGAGYIGTHTCVELMTAGYDVVVIDNLLHAKHEALLRVANIVGRPLSFVLGDVRDAALLDQVFTATQITGVIHLAALKAVGKSVHAPLSYYRNNLEGLLAVLEAMTRHHVKRFVFSSSATVYAVSDKMPIDESFPLLPTNPYGHTKRFAEQILCDLVVADRSWRIATLRYFNPIGAHPSGQIGEDAMDAPNSLMPYISRVAAGQAPTLRVFGSDYDTHDGTGVRDYIHVVDLARGHLAALDTLGTLDDSFTVNLGTGKGYSVIEAIRAFETASGCAVPYEIVARRVGDVATCYANPAKAATLLGWRAEYDLMRMCTDQWRWQVQNPGGFVQR